LASKLASNASPTFTGTTTISPGGSLIVGGVNQTAGVYTNNIEAISPTPAIYMRSGLVISSAYGLEVGQIASNSSANLSFISNCAIGTVATQKNLTVNGLTTTQNLTVPGYATVSGVLTAGQTILCNDLKSSGAGVKILKSDGGTALKIFDSGTAQFYSNVIADANLTVYGELSATKGPWFCAGRVNTANTGSIISNYGRVSFSVFRDAQASVTITMASAHPQGSNYVVFASSARAFATVEHNISGVGMRTSTSFQIVMRNSDFSTLANDTNGLTFMVV
jgi:hypothetical protein